MHWNNRFYNCALQCIIDGTALAEVAVLIAQHALDRHHSYSHFLLSHLILSNGTTERICVSRTFFVGTFMASLGGLIRYKCYRALGTMFTFEMSIRKDHMLVTSGPYSIVRHPGYTGIFLVIIGIFLVHGLKVSFPLIVVVINTEPFSSGFLGKGEWYTEYHSNENNNRNHLRIHCCHNSWTIETDVERGWGVTSVGWEKMGILGWESSI